MKQMTQHDIDILKALIEEKRAHLRGIMNDLNDISTRLHACKTHKEINVVHADFKDSIRMAEEELAFIKKAKKQIAAFYKPAA